MCSEVQYTHSERQAKQCFTLVVSGAVAEGKSRKPGVAGVDTDATRPSHSLHVLARSVDEADLLLIALRRSLLSSVVQLLSSPERPSYALWIQIYYLNLVLQSCNEGAAAL